jgi:hypothetical protein
MTLMLKEVAYNVCLAWGEVVPTAIANSGKSVLEKTMS